MANAVQNGNGKVNNKINKGNNSEPDDLSLDGDLVNSNYLRNIKNTRSSENELINSNYIKTPTSSIDQ